MGCHLSLWERNLGLASPPLQPCLRGGKGGACSQHPQDALCRGRDKGAPGDLPTAWHSPMPKEPPSVTPLLPVLSLGSPQPSFCSEGPV